MMVLVECAGCLAAFTVLIRRQCGFRRTKMKGGIYTRSVGGGSLFVEVYVNDLVIVGIDEHIELVSRELRAKFPVKDPGPVTDVLHIRSW
jgi:hypothetical protein